MKGMQKIIRGSDFAGVLSYAIDREGKEDKGKLIGGNVGRGDIATLTRRFNAAADTRPDIAKPVWHNSLRLPDGETLAPAAWSLICDDYMRKMGFSQDHPRAYVLHDDEDGQHIHIIASRVDASGNVYLGQNENLISTKMIYQLERDYELKRSDYMEVGQATGKKPRLKKGEIEKAVRTGKAPGKLKLAAALEQATAGKPSVIQMCERLEAAGIYAIPNIATTGKLNGFSFVVDGVTYKGGQAGFSAQEMQRAGVTYDKNRDYQQLCGIRDQGRKRADIQNADVSRRGIEGTAAASDSTERSVHGAARDKRVSKVLHNTSNVAVKQSNSERSSDSRRSVPAVQSPLKATGLALTAKISARNQNARDNFLEMLRRTQEQDAPGPKL